MVKADEDIKPIILTLEDNTVLNSEIDVCNVNDFETFADVKNID
jgi:hypothetical protein